MTTTSVETFVTVNRGLRDDAARWAACLAHAKRTLTARIPADRSPSNQVTFGVVEYPRKPTRPGELVYRFVLAHTSLASAVERQERAQRDAVDLAPTKDAVSSPA